MHLRIYTNLTDIMRAYSIGVVWDLIKIPNSIYFLMGFDIFKPVLFESKFNVVRAISDWKMLPLLGK